MQYSYFSVISGFLYKTEDPFRNCSCSSPEISLLVLKTFQHSKRNFVSPRGHVISSIEACLFWIVAYGKRNITFEARLFCFMAYRTTNFYIWSALNDSKIGGYKVTGGNHLEANCSVTMHTPYRHHGRRLITTARVKKRSNIVKGI